MRAFKTAVLGLLISFVTACGGGGGVDPGQLQRALEARGITTIRVTQTNVARPVIVIGGFSDPEALASDLSALFECLGNPFDAVFHVESRSSDFTALRPVAEVLSDLKAAIEEARLAGVSELVIVGHNTGGLLARRALVERALDEAADPTIALGIGVRLVTLYTPFAGIEAATLPATYPQEFLSTSEFITAPGSLPGYVQHFKFNVSIAQANTLSGSNPTDGLFADRQSQAVVESDPQLALNLTQDFTSAAFVVTKRVIEAFEAAGYSPFTCTEERRTRESLSLEGAEAFSALRFLGQTTKGGNQFFDPQNPFHVLVDERGLSECGIQLRLENGFFDRRQPTVVIVHGDEGVGENYDNLESMLSTSGFNTVRFVYQPGGNSVPAFQDEIDEFTDGLDSLEEVVDAFIRAMDKLQQITGDDCLSVVAHSMGGLIARRAGDKDRENTLDDRNYNVALTTVASPFDGADSLSGVGGSLASFFLNIGSIFPGDEYYRALVNDDFLGGSLGDNIFHCQVITDEADTSLDVITVEGQERDNVRQDPQRIDSELTEMPWKVGHVDVVKLPRWSAVLRNKVISFKSTVSSLTEEPQTATTTTTTTTTSTTVVSEAEEESSTTTTVSSTTSTTVETVVTTSSTTTTTLQTSLFDCPSGTYNASSNGCGVGGFSIEEQGSSLRVTNFGSNGVLTFGISSSSLATASGIDILGAPNHDCRLTCTSSAGVLEVFCQNSFGGTCSQTNSR